MNQVFSQHCASLLSDLRNCLRGTVAWLFKFYLTKKLIIFSFFFRKSFSVGPSRVLRQTGCSWTYDQQSCVHWGGDGGYSAQPRWCEWRWLWHDQLAAAGLPQPLPLSWRLHWRPSPTWCWGRIFTPLPNTKHESVLWIRFFFFLQSRSQLDPSDLSGFKTIF